MVVCCRDFVISYLTVDDEEHLVQLSLLNDWDLDAAILNCATQSYLKLIVQCKQADDGKCGRPRYAPTFC